MVDIIVGPTPNPGSGPQNLVLDDLALAIIDDAGLAIGSGTFVPTLVYTGLYLFLRPHYISDQTINAGETRAAYNWLPSLAVDPLDTTAVNNFYAGGPRVGGQYEDLNLFQLPFYTGGSQPIRPVTYWIQSAPRTWKLTGLGVNLAPIMV